jgi:hypothetical protein
MGAALAAEIETTPTPPAALAAEMSRLRVYLIVRPRMDERVIPQAPFLRVAAI